MMNFILLVIAVYLALVGASLTIMVLAMSNWYIKKTKKMTKKLMDEFTDDF